MGQASDASGHGESPRLEAEPDEEVKHGSPA